MKSVFADTLYFIAILNANDAAHSRALAFSNSHDLRLLTTAFVLIELADGLSRSAQRQSLGRLVEALLADPDSTIVPADQRLFEEGRRLYDSRPDKSWSLTDCISFAVMKEQGLTEALTGDHHFEQAGFTALLK